LINTATGDSLTSDVHSQDDDVEEFYSSSCLTMAAEYTFTVYNTCGDGICCEFGTGLFKLQYGYEVVVDHGGLFEDLDTYSFTFREFRLSWQY
jgi:hypothetical protein